MKNYLNFCYFLFEVCTKWLVDACAKALELSFKDPKLNLNVVPIGVRKLWGGAKTLAGKDLDTRVENLYVKIKTLIKILIKIY